MATTIKPKWIPQAKLARFFELKALLKEKEELRLELIKMAAEDKLPCQPGKFVLSIEKSDGQVRPKWKEEGIKLAAKHDEKGWAEQVIKETPAGKPSYEVDVVDRDKPVA